MVTQLHLPISPVIQWSPYRLFVLLAQAVNSLWHREEDEILNENVLIEKCKQDPGHFGAIYEQYYEPVFRFVYKRTDDEFATAEITSKVFFNCLNNIKRYTFQGVPFASWVFRIAVNEINQYFRSRKNTDRTVSLEEHHVGTLMEEISLEVPARDPEYVLAALLEKLAPEELQFLELRFFEGRSFREVGYLTGLTEVNAKVKTYRILKKLKEIAEELKLVV